MPMQKCAKCDDVFGPYSFKALTDEDLKVLNAVLQAETQALDAIEQCLDAIGPREAGVTDSVYEVLNAYRAGRALLAEELNYRLSGLFTVPQIAANHPHFEPDLPKILAREIKVRGLE